MYRGYIKLWRSFRDSPYYKELKAKAVWIECLFRAKHSGKKRVCLGRKTIELTAGQFLMGRGEFGESIGVSASTTWFWLLKFEVDNMIDIKKTTKGSIVTVKNWKKYQKVDNKVDNKKTTNEQQMDTTNNDNNDNNDNNSTNVELQTIASETREYGNPLINKMVAALKGYQDVQSLDGTQQQNRYACNRLIKKIAKEFKARVNKEPTDEELYVSFELILSKAGGIHPQNLTSFMYFDKHFVSILNSSANIQQGADVI